MFKHLPCKHSLPDFHRPWAGQRTLLAKRTFAVFETKLLQVQQKLKRMKMLRIALTIERPTRRSTSSWDSLLIDVKIVKQTGIISFLVRFILYTWLAETDADTQNGRRHPGKTRNPPTVLGQNPDAYFIIYFILRQRNSLIYTLEIDIKDEFQRFLIALNLNNQNS